MMKADNPGSNASILGEMGGLKPTTRKIGAGPIFPAGALIFSDYIELFQELQNFTFLIPNQ